MLVRVIRFAVFVVSLLPLRIARGLGALVGLGAWYLKSSGARITLVNLGLCFPERSEAEIHRLARRSMKHWGMTFCEVPVVWRRGAEALRWVKAVHSDGLKEKIQSSPEGIMFVSPHLGNWEVMGYWVNSHGPTTTLYQPPRRLDLEDLLLKARTKTGATLVPTSVKGVGQLIKALKRGEFVGILPDMEPAASGGVFAPFFGVPALTMTLIHNLQRRTGARVILCFGRRVRGGFELVLSEPPGIDSESAEESAAALNRGIEALVTRAPEQYQWEYKRFKRRPEGYPKLYR